MAKFKLRAHVAFALLSCITPVAFAQEMNKEDEDLFDLLTDDSKPKTDPKIDPQPGKPTPPPAPKVAPNLDLILEKWAQYEAAKTAKLNDKIGARRKIAVEILSKKAETASGAAKESLLREIQSLSKLAANEPISVAIPANEDARMSALCGYWECVGDKWHRTFYSDGTLKTPGDSSMTWRWFDKEAGILIQGTDFLDLLIMDSSNTIRGVNSKGFRFTLKRASPQPQVPFAEPAVVKMAADEAADRTELKQSLLSKRRLLVKFLRAKAKKADSKEAEDAIRGKYHKLEAMEESPQGFEEKVAGIWHWGESTTMRFLAEGKVVNAETGAPVGKWAWASGRRRNFVFVLGSTAKLGSVFLVNTPTDSKDLKMSVYRPDGEPYRISRTLE